MTDVLECDGEACVDIDTGLSVVPATTAAVHEAACFSTTVIGILGVENIVDLAQDTDIRGVSLLTPFLYRQLIL
jgi:hypothetical protein